MQPTLWAALMTAAAGLLVRPPPLAGRAVAPPQALRIPPQARASLAKMALCWRSGLGDADANWHTALLSTLANLSWTDDSSPTVAFLFCPIAHADQLREACDEVIDALSPEVLVGVVGAGVAGSSLETMGEPTYSLLAGELPEDTGLRPFLFGDAMPNWPTLSDALPAGAQPSFLLFADPFSPIQQAVTCLDGAYPGAVVAGGLSCPASMTADDAPSLALYARADAAGGGAGGAAAARVLPRGTVLGLVLGGPRLEVHTACAQGAAPVGPTFTVTAGRDNLVEELDGRPAMQALQGVAKGASGDARLLRLLQRALLVGVTTAEDAGSGSDAAAALADDEPDFLIRQVAGATPQGGIVIGDRVEVGRTRVRFHVRDATAAEADLRLVLGRYRVARQFSGRFAGTPTAPAAPLATLLFACNGRGTNMYDAPHHDSRAFASAVADTPLAGFFCNGEIGPAGVQLPAAAPGPAAAMADGEQEAKGGAEGTADATAAAAAAAVRTHLHGFTSVYAMLYETEAAE